MLHRPSGVEEARLIAAIARGDNHAFDQLYRLYHPRLARFIQGMVRHRPLAEEVLDDTMMVVWNKAGAFDGSSQVSTWIFAIAYRKSLAGLRRHREPIEDADAERRECPEAGPEQRLGRRQSGEGLRRAMGQLSADHRAVVDLTYFHDIGYREIATIMNCPVDTVKTRMFHARRRLRGLLAGELADWL